jgi:hypothetical protein
VFGALLAQPRLLYAPGGGRVTWDSGWATHAIGRVYPMLRNSASGLRVAIMRPYQKPMKTPIEIYLKLIKAILKPDHGPIKVY